jgi:DNA-binding transcriptional regulator YiaG
MSANGVFTNLAAGSTGSSASGDTGRRRAARLVFVSLIGAVVAPGTTAGILLDPSFLRPTTSKTDAGQPAAEGATHVTAITELRRLTGLTWDQFATLFGVSRRAVHFWASGKAMTATNDEHLQRSLGCLRIVNRGSTLANKEALFSPVGAGITPFDLLVQHQYEEFIDTLGRAVHGMSAPMKFTRVSSDRLPRPPYVMASAREDAVHQEAGSPRPGRVVRAARGR